MGSLTLKAAAKVHILELLKAKYLKLANIDYLDNAAKNYVFERWLIRSAVDLSVEGLVYLHLLLTEIEKSGLVNEFNLAKFHHNPLGLCYKYNLIPKLTEINNILNK